MIAYLDCFSGISGDMLLGALLDAGLDLDALRVGLATLDLRGYTLDMERVGDRGLSGVRALVKVDAETTQPHRRLADIEELIGGSSLSATVRERAVAVFTRLAGAEARSHGTTPAKVHFHEVGAVDAIVDVVGTLLGFELLGVDVVYCSELPLTSGRAESSHGVLPVPAPATLELLKDTGAVWRPVPAEGELVTPTGAAVLATLARFERPAMTVRAVGYGFGRRNLPWANCLRLVLGEPAANAISRGAEDFERDEVAVLESNIDNMTGEALGWLMERLLAEGALDVSYAPLQMKKQRPGTLLLVVARPDAADRLAGLILRESGTLGVRVRRTERVKADRREEEVETPLGHARVKLKLIGGRVVAVSPEYDDCRALAERTGLPIEVVMERVAAAARAQFGTGG
ncbi:MAG TPA: nickel pincer cofactor biosynthesis protein LarC [Ktedonobacterales bacterium]|nr:nickel pincer cofactor biosynthesis protein LarC [Ktedonobacterales bacterium]